MTPPPTADRNRSRPRRAAAPVLAAALALAVLVAGCADGSGGSDGDAARRASGRATAPQGATSTSTTTEAARPAGCGVDPTSIGARSTHERVDLTSGGADRWYTRYVPAAYDGSPTPLVVDLHGYQSGAGVQTMMSELGPLADQEGFVVATPQGNGELPYWNAVPHDDLPDDVGFVEDVIDDLGTSLCIDPARIYVDGFSNGAFLASLVACRLPDRVAAVAAVAGLLLPAGCTPSRPVPVLAIHGTADRYVSFTGGPNPALDDLTWDDQSRRAFDGLAFADVTTTASRWAELDGCGPDPTRTEVSGSVDLIGYGGCDGGSAVQLYVVDGGGHAWPGSEFSAASASILGPTTRDIDASAVIWSFFRDHPMAP